MFLSWSDDVAGMATKRYVLAQLGFVINADIAYKIKKLRKMKLTLIELKF